MKKYLKLLIIVNCKIFKKLLTVKYCVIKNAYVFAIKHAKKMQHSSTNKSFTILKNIITPILYHYN